MDPKLNTFTIGENVIFHAYDQDHRRLGNIVEILFKFNDYWELKIKDVRNGNIYCVIHSFLEDSSYKVAKVTNSISFIMSEA